MSTQASLPAAVIFDVDGTLTDTEPAWERVRAALAAEDGADYRPEHALAMMGMSTREWSTYLSEVVGLNGSAEDCARRTIDGMRELYHGGVDILPGARQVVRAMAELVPVGIASSSPVVLIEAAIEELGIGDVVSAHVSTEQVERGKPAPDGYLRCCELLGVDPTQCLAIEDSTAGITSALAAGMSVVAIPQPFHQPDEELLARCTVLPDLTHLTPQLVGRLATTDPA
ncbi:MULTISPECIES: HAD family hydrolase [unclassified Luteococcus]|uniref:HAD family hydrolase n=1 Tax=unclassified Luteococcus TaxID=2639923 RepID=UPI00313ED89E